MPAIMMNLLIQSGFQLQTQEQDLSLSRYFQIFLPAVNLNNSLAYSDYQEVESQSKQALCGLKERKLSKIGTARISWFQQAQFQEQEQQDIRQIIEHMQQRKSWTTQEDTTLRMIVESAQHKQQNGDLDWYTISHQLKDNLSIYKTPKQCNDRWDHHLKPGSVKESEWTYEEQIQLFQLQVKLGNKWTSIASKLSNKSDGAVKNFFYATLRKSVRLINSFICLHRHEEFYKNFKTFPENCIGKIIAQEQNKKTNKMRVTKDKIWQQAREIKTLLLEISRDAGQRDLIEQAIFKISQFNRNCRRLRSKKRKASQDQCDQQNTQKSQTTYHSLKNSKDRSEQEKDQQLFLSIEQRIPNQIKKQFNYNTDSLYLYECQQSILLPLSVNQENQNQNQVLKNQRKDSVAEKVSFMNLLNKISDYEKIGSENVSEGIFHFPSFFLRNQELPKTQELLFDSFIEPMFVFDQEYSQEYP